MRAVAQAGARILAAYVILTAGASWQGKMELRVYMCVLLMFFFFRWLVLGMGWDGMRGMSIAEATHNTASQAPLPSHSLLHTRTHTCIYTYIPRVDGLALREEVRVALPRRLLGREPLAGGGAGGGGVVELDDRGLALGKGRGEGDLDGGTKDGVRAQGAEGGGDAWRGLVVLWWWWWLWIVGGERAGRATDRSFDRRER